MDGDGGLPLQKVQISGPILASLLHRFSSSPGSLHGLLFGHVTLSTPSSLSDDPASISDLPSSPDTSPLLTATVTSFVSCPSHLPLPDSTSSSVIGWFSGRRRTPLRTSLNEATKSHALASSTTFHVSTTQQQGSASGSLSLPASVFLLLTTPFQDQLIHTHEYKAFQYRVSTGNFEPKSLDIINVGPSFRSHYGSFSPYSVFPLIPCELSGSSAMAEDNQVTTSVAGKKDQTELDFYAEGFEIGRLGRLMGSDAALYTAELEDLYSKMLAKLDGLARSVETSSAKVLDLENHNTKFRLKVAGLE